MAAWAVAAVSMIVPVAESMISNIVRCLLVGVSKKKGGAGR
jgi:hypothetical protein